MEKRIAIFLVDADVLQSHLLLYVFVVSPATNSIVVVSFAFLFLSQFNFGECWWTATWKLCQTYQASLFCCNHIIDGFSRDKEPGHVNSSLGGCVPAVSACMASFCFIALLSTSPSFSLRSFRHFPYLSPFTLSWNCTTSLISGGSGMVLRLPGGLRDSCFPS